MRNQTNSHSACPIVAHEMENSQMSSNSFEMLLLQTANNNASVKKKRDRINAITKVLASDE